jgi:hypothetical protein
VGSAAPILWYRPSIRRAAFRTALVAAALTIGGGFILGALRVVNVDFGSPWLGVYIVGIALVAMGPLVLWRGHLRWLGQERVLTISQDGIRWQVGEAVPAFCAWVDLGALTIEDETLVLATASADPWRLPLPFEGIEARELVQLLGELRQKALLGLPVRPRGQSSDDDD